jgi:hypothetical protein
LYRLYSDATFATYKQTTVALLLLSISMFWFVLTGNKIEVMDNTAYLFLLPVVPSKKYEC